MSVPQPSSAYSNGAVTGRTVAVPDNTPPVNIPPFVSTLARCSPFMVPSYRSAPNATSIKLSILMCAYNEERTIMDAITEVLAADYPCDMELIVVDDGSTDAT